MNPQSNLFKAAQRVHQEHTSNGIAISRSCAVCIEKFESYQQIMQQSQSHDIQQNAASYPNTNLIANPKLRSDPNPIFPNHSNANQPHIVRNTMNPTGSIQNQPRPRQQQQQQVNLMPNAPSFNPFQLTQSTQLPTETTPKMSMGFNLNANPLLSHGAAHNAQQQQFRGHTALQKTSPFGHPLFPGGTVQGVQPKQDHVVPLGTKTTATSMAGAAQQSQPPPLYPPFHGMFVVMEFTGHYRPDIV